MATSQFQEQAGLVSPSLAMWETLVQVSFSGIVKGFMISFFIVELS